MRLLIVIPFIILQIFHLNVEKKSKMDLICNKWSLSQIDGKVITLYSTDVDYKEIYVFNRNNTFSYFDFKGAYNQGKGIWEYNKDSTRLGFCFSKLNNEILNCKKIEHKWYILELTENKLRVGIQGKDNFKQFVYIPY